MSPAYTVTSPGATASIAQESPSVQSLFNEIHSIKTQLTKLDKTDVQNITHNLRNVELRVNSLEMKLSEQSSQLSDLQNSREFYSKMCDDLKVLNEQINAELKVEKLEREKLSCQSHMMN